MTSKEYTKEFQKNKLKNLPTQTIHQSAPTAWESTAYAPISLKMFVWTYSEETLRFEKETPHMQQLVAEKTLLLEGEIPRMQQLSAEEILRLEGEIPHMQQLVAEETPHILVAE